MRQGDFCWYELVTSDLAAAKAFYEKAIGWTIADSGMPDMTYLIMSAGEAQIAGMMVMPDEYAANGGRPVWAGYVAVDNVDEMAATFESEGGKLLRPADDIPGVGRFAVVADPLGAAICLFHGEDEAPPAPALGTPGTVGWHELYTEDVDQAFAFYSKHFGWEKLDTMDMGEMGPYVIFGRGETMMGGLMKRPENVPMPFWGFYVCVDQIEPAMARVKDGGGQILNGPVEVPGGTLIAQCLDPQGAYFAINATS